MTILILLYTVLVLMNGWLAGFWLGDGNVPLGVLYLFITALWLGVLIMNIMQ